MLNKEKVLPPPPLFGTPRASFPARGSRLENPPRHRVPLVHVSHISPRKSHVTMIRPIGAFHSGVVERQ